MVRSAKEWQQFNDRVIAEFRASGDGRVDGFGDLPLAILHTVGARSGRIREIPLIPVDRDGDVLFYGTAEGSPRHPGWVYNLRAHPHITVETAGATVTAILDELTAGEAAEVIDSHAASTPQLANYVASAAPRPIPVFRMRVDTDQ